MAPDVFQEQMGNSSGIQGGDCGYGVNPFRQVIHHHKGGIVPLGVWEFSDHVYGDHLPVSARDLVGISFPTFCVRKVFVWCRWDNGSQYELPMESGLEAQCVP